MNSEIRFRDAVDRLACFNITGEQIYLIDLIPLVEMAWADDRIQHSEVEILHQYLKDHVKTINRLAGCRVLSEEGAISFITDLLQSRPDKALVDEVVKIIADYRVDNRTTEEALETKTLILNGCLDIAASAVTKYPYGLTERFTEEEKLCYHRIQSILGGLPAS